MNNDTARLTQASEATEKTSQSTVIYTENVAAAIEEHTFLQFF